MVVALCCVLRVVCVLVAMSFRWCMLLLCVVGVCYSLFSVY